MSLQEIELKRGKDISSTKDTSPRSELSIEDSIHANLENTQDQNHLCETREEVKVFAESFDLARDDDDLRVARNRLSSSQLIVPNELKNRLAMGEQLD